MMTTASQRTIPKGLAGVALRLREGKATGWGVFHPGSWSMATGGMMLVIAAFLPWVYVSLTQGITGEAFVLRGTDGPGVVTLALGFLAFAGAFVPRRRLAIVHAALPGALTALIVLAQAWNIVSASVQTAWGAFLPGMGVVLAGGGAVVLVKAAWTMARQWAQAPRTA
ncbi:hypothetical protein SAMN05216184_10475 [Georgenia satyanarayanai]|uniref:Uncharacterized protein n=1 Tax=Georgenia satyanarayanai TaxID=860221 RepID=A0A2Y9A7P4_9MICO|nr:hypothetical protein [Georgenia satyanarayanai]PYG00136.1 hypothetical protein A8987_10475 [Georgenia satyanarayanai]SSA40215.1 hypothetical protein SAMN05216184_10475 [Georgenia satyanarayanai]